MIKRSHLFTREMAVIFFVSLVKQLTSWLLLQSYH